MNIGLDPVPVVPLGALYPYREKQAHRKKAPAHKEVI